MTQHEETFQGVIGRTVEESTPWWPEPKRPPENAPNVVVIMLDDLGFAQLGCYGSDVSTPNIDKLAENGLRYNNFHTPAICSPARAALLTGRNPHQTGVSFVSELDTGFPNATGKVRKDTMMVSEMLVEEGYNTFAVGKWHLTRNKELTNNGPFDGWPLGRGFEKFYGFLGGATSQFYPDLVEGNERVVQPKSPEEGYHLTEDITDKAISYVKAQKSEAPDKPFFCYLAYAAPHAPFHAPQEFIDKYKGKYDKGWDKVREEWFERQKELGIIPEDAELPPRNPDVPAWDTLSEDEKRLYARMQEAFAGFLEHTDYHIGRFIDMLEEIDELDHTMIVFLSDNGACAMGGKDGTVNSWNPGFNAVEEPFEQKLQLIDKIGGPETESHYPAGWAMAGNTPLKFYKSFTHEGGVRCPLIVHYPEKIKEKGGIRTQYHHITDIVPTILEVCEVEVPDKYRGIKQKPIYGTSFAYTFNDKDAPTRKEVQHYEVASNRAIWHQGWKAVTTHKPNTSFDDDVWELYDTTKDFSECNNLADKYPEKLQELIDLWWQEAEKYDVFPLDGRSLEERVRLMSRQDGNQGGVERKTFFASPEMFHGSVAPKITGKPFEIRCDVRRDAKTDDGVLVAHGDRAGGYSFYIKDNKLHFYYNCSNIAEYSVISERELPVGELSISFQLEILENDVGNGKLYVNDKLVGEGQIGHLRALGFSFGLFFIGMNERSAICPDYHVPFTFKGEIKRVDYIYGAPNEEDRVRELHAELQIE